MRWDRDYKNPEVINDPTIIPAYGVTDEERAYWNAKQDALQYDDEPTQYSDKHLISGAIYNALQEYKVQTVDLCQAFFWGQVAGLGETKTACEGYAAAALQSETNAAASETNAFASKNAASDSASAASYSASQASISKADAAVSQHAALVSARDSEAYAVGTRNGVPVGSQDPAYHHNAKYYADLGSESIQDDVISLYTTWSSEKLVGIFDAKADLVDGKIPATQLPSYVDDVEEYDSYSDLPATGEEGKIYVTLDTNLTYRWGGSAYVEISQSLAVGETAGTAYEGNKGKANADAITAIQAKIPSNASAQNQMATMGDLPTSLAGLSDDASHRTVTDVEKAGWDSKAAGNHTHDDRYYTEAEIDTKFNGVTFTTEDGVDYINW